MKKKKDRSTNKSQNKSRKSSSKDKNTSLRSVKHRPNINEQNNIYFRKSREEIHPYRSVSPKKTMNNIVFKKTSNLKHAKSGLDLIKNVMAGTNKY